MAIEMRPNDRYGIIGKSGSGKTLFTIVLVCMLVPIDSRDWEIWWLDSKRSTDDVKMLREWGFRPIGSWEARRTSRKYIELDPKNGDIRWQAQMWADRAIKRNGKRGSKVLVVVDEYKHTCISDRHAGPGYEDLHLRGRGLLAGMCGQTQEPVYIPRQLMSQAVHLFLFNVTYPADIKYARGLYADYVPPIQAYGDPHGFYYCHVDGDGAWHYYPHVKAWHDTLTIAA